MSEWISVKERMPEEGDYLVFVRASGIEGHGDFIDVAYMISGVWHHEMAWLISFWMPLPNPPEVV